MSDYNVGDLVEAKNSAGSKIVGRLDVREDGHLFLGAYNWTFPEWIVQNAGFHTITVLEKAAKPLPTEWGPYRDRDGHLWVLDRNGSWVDFSTGKSGTPFPPSRVEQYAPFTRLEPVTE